MLKPIIVYWSPNSPDPLYANYNIEDFNDPEPLSKSAFKSQLGDPYFYICPAIKDVARQVYSVSTKFDENAKIDSKLLKAYHDNEDGSLHPRTVDGASVTENNPLLTCNRNSSLKDHVNFNYGRSWIFFADEPVIAKFTSPWLPPTSPAPGAMVVPGKFNIGNWFRDFHVDYFAPISTTSWTYSKNVPIFYIELETDRPIIFKRFDIRENEVLKQIANECMLTSQNFDKPYGLEKRYKDFRKKNHHKTILSELSNVTK